MPDLLPADDAPTASAAAGAKATLLGFVLVVTGLLTFALSGRPVAWGAGAVLMIVGLGLIVHGLPHSLTVFTLERERGQPGMVTVRTEDETRPIRAERITDVRAVRLGAPAGADPAHAWVTQIQIDTGERLTLQPDGPVAREVAEAMAAQVARLKP